MALRRIAIGKGYKLNEYGVFEGERALAGRTEEEVYARARPGLRAARAAREQRRDRAGATRAPCPGLIESGSLRGDLQTQTTWTDGADTIEEMVAAAQQLGLAYIAITDHTEEPGDGRRR